MQEYTGYTINVKKCFLFIPMAVLIVFCSWERVDQHVFNQNSWSIRIGKKNVMSSDKNKIGDSVFVARQGLKPTHSLSAGVYLCGMDGLDAQVTLTIENEKGKIIKECLQKQNWHLGYGAKISLKDILLSSEFNRAKIISIFFAIDDPAAHLNTRFLLGKIQLK